jgi:hypothetical protein
MTRPLCLYQHLEGFEAFHHGGHPFRYAMGLDLVCGRASYTLGLEEQQRRPGEFFLAGGFEQRMEGRPRPFELCANRLAVAIVTVQRRTDCPFWCEVDSTGEVASSHPPFFNHTRRTVRQDRMVMRRITAVIASQALSL